MIGTLAGSLFLTKMSGSLPVFDYGVLRVSYLDCDDLTVFCFPSAFPSPDACKGWGVKNLCNECA